VNRQEPHGAKGKGEMAKCGQTDDERQANAECFRSDPSLCLCVPSVGLRACLVVNSYPGSRVATPNPILNHRARRELEGTERNPDLHLTLCSQWPLWSILHRLLGASRDLTGVSL
jgi:hypothetical protein